MIRNANEGDRCVTGGAIAGIAGGLALHVLMVVHNAVNGFDVWPSIKAAALPFFGERVLAPGFDPLPAAIGFMSHYGVSIFWGVMFAVLGYGLSRVATLAAAVGWSLVSWFGMYWVALPLLGWGELARTLPVNMALFQHLVFAVAMGVAFLPFQRTYVVQPALPNEALG